jgi:leader peptidase (prepilin peptidase)/N-methyltransferase
VIAPDRLPLVLLFAVAGALLGVVADRLSARWPAHEDGRVRGVDWRSVAVPLVGGLAFAGLPTRWSEPRDLLLLTLFFAALVVLLATDLDQRLLPDVITLPMIPIALVVLLLGADPLLAGKGLGTASGLIAGIAAPILLLASNLVLRGGLGIGDVKLAVSLGLVCGVSRLFAGFVLASAASSVVLVLLLLTRRLTLKSYIPFGPVLICAAFVAALLP